MTIVKTKPKIDRVAIDIAHGLLDAARDDQYLTEFYVVQRKLHDNPANSYAVAMEFAAA